MEQIISNPNNDDRAQLREQIAVVNNILAENYVNSPQLIQEFSDLDLLQAILDDGILQPERTHELQCLGIALGEVI